MPTRLAVYLLAAVLLLQADSVMSSPVDSWLPAWQQGRALRDAGKLAEAEFLLRRAADLAEAADSDEGRAASLYLLSLTLFEQEKSDAALQMVRGALERVSKDHPLSGLLEVTLGEMLHFTGALQEAESAIASALRRLRPGDSWATIAYNQLAALRQTQGREEQAEIAYRRALAECRRAGLPPAFEAQILLNLVSSYDAQQRDEPLEAHLNEALALIRQEAAPHPRVHARALELLGNLRFRQQRMAEARSAFEEAVSIAQGMAGDRVVQLAFLRNALGAVLCRENHCDQGRRMIEEARTSLAGLSRSHPALPMMDINLAEAMRQSGDPKSAEAVLRRALNVLEKRTNTNGRQMAVALDRLSAVLQELGRNAEAKECSRRVRELRAAIPARYTVDAAELDHR